MVERLRAVNSSSGVSDQLSVGSSPSVTTMVVTLVSLMSRTLKHYFVWNVKLSALSVVIKNGYQPNITFYSNSNYHPIYLFLRCRALLTVIPASLRNSSSLGYM